ncbi:MAG: ROK family glucokinase [Clostridium sp.]|jgi:glucokinase|uniref:ROK family protein n=1 Tax=Clostridium sp. TaxID=1506 RepID=UPI0025BC3212|nr:ROK family glucokinase [Clostridium sp.]MCH3963480.1 ROK family glucokinase [Clostridium sp.]MCI1714621.1 ROK family glucokinase [Clostridium sp.]MCI1799190.1 ROK family glucokinase [Clostridium sp.]MCI1812804.1 ROK family glucokinase [Clostridium sp.]MCI1869694.1 ROK family glucokinase [Clostridium sp.]
MNKKYVLGIDLGGTKISGALSDISGSILYKYTVPTDAFRGEEKVLEKIIEVIEKVLASDDKSIEDIEAIGIGSPGPLDAKNGIIITTPNLPFRNFKLVDPIKKKFGIPVYLDNDANVGAIGEFMFGAGKGTKNMIFITVSTGIGGGAIINGQIYRGNTCNALEIGHMTLEKNGPRCNCGNYGCAEALASGTAIGKKGEQAVLNKEYTALKKHNKVTSYEVFEEAKKGDKIACEILNESLEYLGICVANVITSFDPEMVVIGGGVSKGGNIVLKKIQQVVNRRCFAAMAKSCRIVKAELGTDAGVMGAAALAVLQTKIQ